MPVNETQEIKATAACKNQFFHAASPHVSHELMKLIIAEWFPITYVFCTSVVQYVGLLAERTYSAPPTRKENLERALLTPLQIAAGEFGMGSEGLPGIHYRMFARLGEPLGISLTQLYGHPRGRFRETAELVDTIRGAMKDFHAGAACIRVVEGSAYDIVDAMDKIFTPQRQEDGTPRFSAKQLEYIRLHLILEREHDEQSSDFIAQLNADPEDERKIQLHVQTISQAFGDYWNALSRVVFPAEPAAYA